MLVLIGTFNFIVDPYGIYNTMHIAGLNFPKAEAQNYEKLVKAYLVSEIKPDAVVMGTSRSGVGIDPESVLWNGDGVVYNLSIADGTIYEIRRFLQHLIAIKPPKKLVLGLDFFIFNAFRGNASDYSENLLAVNSAGEPNDDFKRYIILSSVFSYSAIKTSIKTIKKSSQQKIHVLDPASGMRQEAINGDVYHTDQLINLPAINDEDIADIVFGLAEDHFMNLKYFLGEDRVYAFENNDTGSATLDEFRKIVRLCLDNDIELYMFISPSHARLFESIRAVGLWPLFEQWKREVVQVLEEAYEGGDYALWDFSGYNSITTTEVVHGRMREYKDPSHYLPVVGNMVLSRLFSKELENVPVDFGRRLSGSNIEQVLESVRMEQRAYHETHKATVKAIEQMAAGLGMSTRNVAIQGGDRPVAARSVPNR